MIPTKFGLPIIQLLIMSDIIYCHNNNKNIPIVITNWHNVRCHMIISALVSIRLIKDGYPYCLTRIISYIARVVCDTKDLIAIAYLTMIWLYIFIHLFIINKLFWLARVLVDPESILGTLRVRRDIIPLMKCWFPIFICPAHVLVPSDIYYLFHMQSLREEFI